MDRAWWTDHVAYAVDQRRQMRTGYLATMTMLLLAATAGTLLAAQASWWIICPVLVFAIPLCAKEIRDWTTSETNYRRSLCVRRAGLAEAARK